jgi:hypothetical protein
MYYKNVDDITPVEEYDGVYYKRDDLYRPFDPEPLNGGKVRQCITLIQSNLEKIKTVHNGGVATETSINSPQGIIISRVCKEFGLKCIIGVGGQGINNNIICDEIRKNGAEIVTLSKMAYSNVLLSKLRDLNKTYNYFIIQFGINVSESTEIRDYIANQVVNIPDELDNLVIPTGSGICAGAILYGIKKFGKKVKNVWVIQIAGYDRTATINKISGGEPYIYLPYNKFPYSKKLKVLIRPDFQLDTVYESKGYHWMINAPHTITDYNWKKSICSNSDHIEIGDKKTLFWCVGNASMYR